MQTYARVVNGVVAEIITPPLDLNGDQWPMDKCYPLEFVESCVEITQINPKPAEFWTYDGIKFSSPEPAGPDIESMAVMARQQRDTLLRSVYDPGISMAQRAIRMAKSPEQVSYAEEKVQELDAYAEALQMVPDQPGFPLSIVWPEILR